MKKILLITICTSVFLLSACNKFLDKLPKGLVIAETTNDFRQLLDNADTRYSYNLSMVSSYVDVVSDDSQMDSSWYEWERDDLHAKQLYGFEPEVWLPDGAADDDVWKQNYYVNTTISNILDEIVLATDNPKVQKQLISEAKVHRAYAYLTLVNIYSKHYSKSTATADLGVPFYLNPVDLPNLKRASVQKIYDFIVSELIDAIPDLPEKVDHSMSHRPTKAAAYAILARTYLYMGEYEKALDNADKSLKIEDFLYDYNDIYTGTPSPTNLNPISRINDQEMLLHKTTMKKGRLDRYLMLDPETFDKIYDGYKVIDENTVENDDLRRVLWFNGINSDGKITAERLTYDYNRRRYAQDQASVDYIPVATPEMYLTRAECNARLGNLSKALDDINQLRKHRFKAGTYTDIVSNDKDLVLSEVLKERRRELYGKELRLFDIKRLGLPISHLKPGTNEQWKSLLPNDNKMVWPIFYHNIELNPEIEQSPRD